MTLAAEKPPSRTTGCPGCGADDTERLLTQYAKLDDYGRHTISSVMQVEYDRCSGEK